MHRAIPNKLFSVLLGTTAVLLMSGNALAVTVNRTQVQYAAGSCQGNLPVSATQLRARPLAIKNEANHAAPLSAAPCPRTTSLGRSTSSMASRSPTPLAWHVNISCTLVTGNIDFPINFFPKTVSIAANALGVVSWTPAADNGDVPFNNSLNYSCSIPPGVEINGVFTNIAEEVGADACTGIPFRNPGAGHPAPFCSIANVTSTPATCRDPARRPRTPPCACRRRASGTRSQSPSRPFVIRHSARSSSMNIAIASSVFGRVAAIAFGWRFVDLDLHPAAAGAAEIAGLQHQ